MRVLVQALWLPSLHSHSAALLLRYEVIYGSLLPRIALMLRSLKAIRKEAAIVAMILGRPSPDPGVGPQVELRGGNAGGLLNLTGVGKALSS